MIVSVKVSKALADETRLGIFHAISATYHINCGEIVATRGVSAATVSHHLKILSDAGLIVCRREGQFIYCEAVPETLAPYTRALSTNPPPPQPTPPQPFT